MTKNRVLWIIQVLLALMFLFAGGVKLVLPVEPMLKQTPMLSGAFLRFVGVCEVLGGDRPGSAGTVAHSAWVDAAGRGGTDRDHDRRRFSDADDRRRRDGAHAIRGRPAVGFHCLRALGQPRASGDEHAPG